MRSPAYAYLDCEITKEVMSRNRRGGLEVSLSISNMLNKKQPPAIPQLPLL